MLKPLREYLENTSYRELKGWDKEEFVKVFTSKTLIGLVNLLDKDFADLVKDMKKNMAAVNLQEMINTLSKNIEVAGEAIKYNFEGIRINMGQMHVKLEKETVAMISLIKVDQAEEIAKPINIQLQCIQISIFNNSR
eukprot:TRINITY_DN2504_c0_g1_i1.p3 TRINITY_DN2504_c0_g1~~TRINITY_DN2504_c0_g1_i1.p3  ORF type:complete len:137 (-),score=11.06 TRINITY_DN2504_c0_g1_i1:672-1082(-)